MSALISLVIPMHNEASNVELLWERVVSVLEKEQQPFEAIFVDDGSRDETYEVLKKLHNRDPRAKVIRLSRNFGHQGALRAGVEKSNGAAVIMMDGDLQHPPEVIPELLKAWRGGANIVHTLRNYGKLSFKETTSMAFYRLLSRLSPVEIKPGMADFRLIDNKVREFLKLHQEYEIFFRGLIPLLGLTQAYVRYTAGERNAGQTKYTLLPMLRLAVNGITSLSTMPLYFGVFLGSAISLLSLIYGCYVLLIRLYWGTAITGWSSLILSVLLIGGIQMILLGIIGVYIGKIFLEVKRRPAYLIAETLE